MTKEKKIEISEKELMEKITKVGKELTNKLKDKSLAFYFAMFGLELKEELFCEEWRYE